MAKIKFTGNIGGLEKRMVGFIMYTVALPVISGLVAYKSFFTILVIFYFVGCIGILLALYFSFIKEMIFANTGLAELFAVYVVIAPLGLFVSSFIV